MTPTEDAPWIPRSRRGLLGVLAVIVLLAAIPATVVSYVIILGVTGQIRTTQISACERITADRVDNARGWTEVEESVRSRSLDLHLPRSERERAAQSAVIYGESANQLRSRLFECEPLVRDGDHIIDDARLRETLGEL